MNDITDEAEKMLDRLAAHMWRTDMDRASVDGTPVLRPHVHWGPMAVKRLPIGSALRKQGFKWLTVDFKWLTVDNATAWPEEAFAPHWKPLDTPDADIAADAHAALSSLIAENKVLRDEAWGAWAERNKAVAKVKAWEATVYVEGLPLRAVRVDEWGPGEGETVAIPDITPNKLTELLDRLAAAEARLASTEGGTDE